MDHLLMDPFLIRTLPIHEVFHPDRPALKRKKLSQRRGDELMKNGIIRTINGQLDDEKEKMKGETCCCFCYRVLKRKKLSQRL